jgi:hypothetical protein
MTSNGSANEAPRGTRANELNNAETGGRNDIMTIILANGASYDSKERVVLRRLSLEMRVEAGKRKQGRERGRLIVEFGHKSGSEQNRALRPADIVFCEGEAARSSALGLLRVRIYRRTMSQKHLLKNNAASSEMLTILFGR